MLDDLFIISFEESNFWSLMETSPGLMALLEKLSFIISLADFHQIALGHM